MKKLILLSAVIFLGVMFYMKNLPQKVKVQVAIIDTCGEKIWPLDKNYKLTSGVFKNGKLNTLDLEETSIYHSYLRAYDASYVRVKSMYGVDSFALSYATSDYSNLLAHNSPQNMTMQERTRKKEMKKMMKSAKGTATNGREEYRRSQKGGNYDPLKAFAAHETVKKIIESEKQKATSRDAGLRKWTSLGPGNVGGRTRAIATHPTDPNILFIGTASGGMWKTTNGGSSWSNVSDFLPNMAVSHIQYDPTNPSIMFATTSEPHLNGSAGNSSNGQGGISSGVGLLKSTDGGNTWQITTPNTPNNFDFLWVSALAINPDDTDQIFIGTANTTNQNTTNFFNPNGNIYESKDGGNTWNFLQNILGVPLTIVINPNNTDRMFVGTTDRAYRSSNLTNLQIAFTDMSNNGLPSGGRIELDYALNSPQRLYASVNNNGGEVYRTTDYGQSWVILSPPGIQYLQGQGNYSNSIWVDPVNSNRVIVGGIDLWKSDNGGVTLTKISDWRDDINESSTNQGTSVHADQHVIIEASDYTGTNRKVYIGNDGGIYSTNNITSASQNNGWLDHNNNLRITQFYGGAVSVDGSLMIGGAQDNSFVVDESFGGTTWRVPVTGDGAFAAVNFDDENIAYANVNNNYIWKTTDGGSTWNPAAQFAPFAGQTDFPACGFNTNGCNLDGRFFVSDGASIIGKFLMDKNDPDVLIVGARRLWRNDNAADPDAWSVIKTANGLPPVIYVAMEVGNSSNVIWTGSNTGILEKTTDTGANWDATVGNGIPNRFITDIAISPFSSNRVTVTVGGYGQDNIWYTTDGGVNWSNISLDFDLQVNTITWHPTKDNWLYIGTDFGVFASENNGTDWSIIPVEDENEGPYNGEVSELFWSGDGTDNFPSHLYASTFGRGMWRTSAPIRDKIYVKKDYTGLISNGGLTTPFRTAFDGFDAAGSGSEVIFLSSGNHNATSSSILLDRKIKITLQNGGASVIIK